MSFKNQNNNLNSQPKKSRQAERKGKKERREVAGGPKGVIPPSQLINKSVPRRQYNLTKQDIKIAIENSTLDPKEVNLLNGTYLWFDIIEELVYCRQLIDEYYRAKSTEHKKNAKWDQEVKEIFDPINKIWKSELILTGNHKFSIRNVGAVHINSDFNYDPEDKKCFRVDVKYHGIFSLLPINDYQLGIHKDDEALTELTLNEIDPQVWSPHFWISVINKNITRDMINLDLINTLILLYTELVRATIKSERKAERDECYKYNQEHTEEIKKDPSVRKQVVESQYWNLTDTIRDTFNEEKTLDLNNNKVFIAITNLVNGNPAFYNLSYEYPCINLIEPDYAFTNGKFDPVKATYWCLTHIEEKYYDLIRGTLKRVSENPVANIITLKQATFSRSRLFAIREPEILHPNTIIRKFLPTLFSMSEESEYRSKVILVLANILEAVLKIDCEPEKYERSFENVNGEKVDMYSSGFYWAYGQNDIVATVAATILAAVDSRKQLVKVDSIFEAKRLEQIIDAAVNVLRTRGFKGENYYEVQPLLSFYNLIEKDWFSTISIETEEVAYIRFKFCPLTYMNYWIEKHPEHKNRIMRMLKFKDVYMF